MEYNRNESQTIGTTAAVISQERGASQTKRKGIIIQNTSAAGQVVTLAIDNEAVAGKGIVLYTGGTWQDSQDAGYLPTQKLITAISNLADATISIQERTGGV